jgi:hypothetical protein
LELSKKNCDGSCSTGRLASLEVDPGDMAFSVFLDGEADDLVAVWNFSFFAWK